MTNLHFQIGEKSDGRVDMLFSASFYRDPNILLPKNGHGERAVTNI